MKVHSLPNSKPGNPWKLKWLFVCYLISFFLLEFHQSWMNGLRLVANQYDIETILSFMTPLWGSFTIGLVISAVLTALTGDKFLKTLRQKINKDHLIMIESRLVSNGNFPFFILHGLILLAITLSLLDEAFCTIFGSEEIQREISSLTSTCFLLFQKLRALLFGSGAGIAIWCSVWALKIDQTATTPTLVELRWSRNTSIEFCFIAIILIALLILF